MAKYPWIYIVGVLITTFICSLGIISFRWENNIVRLWNPKNSETLRNFDWLWKNHPPDLRRHSIIFHGENVLDPALFKVGESRPVVFLGFSSFAQNQNFSRKFWAKTQNPKTSNL